MEWYIEAFKKYAIFEGRSSRKAFWFFILFNLIAGFLIGIIDGILGINLIKDGFFAPLYSLAVFIPTIAVTVRRLHDVGKSGWWVLIGIIPFIGTIILIIFCVQQSQSGTNQYGEPPLDITIQKDIV